MLVSTPAIVLHTFRYGDTSKIVRLATRDYGIQSVIAKGALRPRSRFGACLQVHSQGVAQLYLKVNTELHTLSAFDLLSLRPALAGDLRRYAAASVLAELLLRCAAHEANPTLFDLAGEELDRLERATPAAVNTVALAALWRLVKELGFAPTLDRCVRDGRALGPGTVGFSVSEGGVLCARCTRERRTTVLGAEHRAVLERLAAGEDLEPLAPRHATAHRRLLARFVRHHVADGHTLKALDFWEGMPWSTMS